MIMNSLINGFNPAQLSLLLGQLCAVKTVCKKDHYIGIGKLAAQEQRLTVFFECAAHLKKKGGLWPWSSPKKPADMKVLGVIPNFVAHFQVTGVDLTPGDWQKIMTDKGKIFLSFQEKEILETDAFIDFHKKSQL
jgi:hypothetical protein